MANRGSFGSYDTGGPGYGSYTAAPGSANSGGVGDSGKEYTRLTQTVGNNIQKISNNVNQIQRLVNQIGTGADSAELRDKLHQVQHYTQQLAKDTGRLLKDASHLPQPSNPSEAKQRKMQKERLMNEFTSSLNNFQEAQRGAASKEKDSVKRARAHSGLDPFAEKNDQQLLHFDSPSAPTMQSQTQMEANVDLELIHEREQAIRQLESDITDVNQIFKDLGMLVHEQGEMIDSIESNVENAAVHVETGREQLQKAQNYQSKARRKKCICIIIVIVVLAIIGIIIGVTVSQHNK